MSRISKRAGLRGVTGLRRLLRNVPADVTEDIRVEIREAAELIEYDAKVMVPKDDGDLAAAISHKIGRDGLSARIGFDARWKRLWRLAGWRAHFIEFGTIKYRAQPFLFTAWEMNRRDIEVRIGAAVKKTLDRLASYRGGD